MPQYSDLDIAFSPAPGTRDLLILTDEAAVVQSVKNLVRTAFYERPFQPSIGSRVGRLLFEQLDSVTLDALAYTIKDTIEEFEPRATVKEIEIYQNGAGTSRGGPDDQNSVTVFIRFNVLNLPNLVTASVYLRRLR